MLAARHLTILVLTSLVAAGCGGGHAHQVTFGFSENAVNEGLLTPARAAALEQAAGAKVMRVPFDWRRAEPRRDVYRLAVFDRIYRASLARGIRPLWVVALAPRWACERPARCKNERGWPPARREDREWRELVALVARRYPRAAGIEVWNEPNLRAFWQPSPDPARYAELLRSGYRAAKRANPDMPVAGAVVSNVAHPGARGMAMGDFLRAMYRAGAKGYMDALSYHPYTRVRGEPEALATTRSVRRIRDAAGDGDTPLWATEVGYSTTRAEPRRRWSERAQRRDLLADYRLLRAQPDVKMFLVYTLIDGPPPSQSRGYGVVRADGSFKPAFCALARGIGGKRCQGRR